MIPVMITGQETGAAEMSTNESLFFSSCINLFVSFISPELIYVTAKQRLIGYLDHYNASDFRRSGRRAL